MKFLLSHSGALCRKWAQKPKQLVCVLTGRNMYPNPLISNVCWFCEEFCFKHLALEDKVTTGSWNIGQQVSSDKAQYSRRMKIAINCVFIHWFNMHWCEEGMWRWNIAWHLPTDCLTKYISTPGHSGRHSMHCICQQNRCALHSSGMLRRVEW